MIKINSDPTARQLRQFAGIWFPLFALLVGYLAIENFDATRFAYGLWIFAGLAAVVGLAAPKAIKWLFVGLMLLTFPIGFVVSHVVLVLLYYVILTPLGVGLRIFGSDPLSKSLEPQRESYWQPREQIEDPERYFRQF